MNTLSSPDSVRAECNLPASVLDAALLPHTITASTEVRRLLGTTIYDELIGNALADDNDATDPNVDLEQLSEDVNLDEALPTATLEKIEVCSKAESLLAFAVALPYLNIETAGKGIVTAKGWDGSRSELMSINEVKRFVDTVREQAMNLLAPYLLKLDNDTTDNEKEPILQAGNITMIVI